MAKVLVTTNEMQRSDWLDWRRQGIGGSDAAAIAGLNPWKSPMEVYLEKKAQLPEPEDNEYMYWGRVLEDVVAREFSRRTGKKVRRRNAILQHPQYPFMTANVDRLVVGEDAVLECKTANAFALDDWEDDRVPERYIIQCQHYLAVTGNQVAYIAALIGGNEFVWKSIPRDEQIIDYLIQIESEFWEMVESGTPPAFDGSVSSTEVLKLLYPESNSESELILPAEAQALIEQYERASLAEKAAKEHKDEAANKLKALLGDSEVGKIGDRAVTWKTVKSNRFDSKALREAHPNIYNEFTRVSSYRRFSIK